MLQILWFRENSPKAQLRAVHTLPGLLAFTVEGPPGSLPGQVLPRGGGDTTQRALWARLLRCTCAPGPGRGCPWNLARSLQNNYYCCGADSCLGLIRECQFSTGNCISEKRHWPWRNPPTHPKLAAISSSRERVFEPEVAREFTNSLISHFWPVPSTLDYNVGLDYKISTWWVFPSPPPKHMLRI